MNNESLQHALSELAAELEAQGTDQVDLFVVGGAAGLLAGELGGDRTTEDCDLVEVHPADDWPNVLRCAKKVAASLKLPENWLNTESRIFAWMLPLGWKSRCDVQSIGVVRLYLLSRRDLIAAKSMACIRRPADYRDIVAMKPSADEVQFAVDNLLRVQSEHPDRESFEGQIAMLRRLES